MLNVPEFCTRIISQGCRGQALQARGRARRQPQEAARHGHAAVRADVAAQVPLPQGILI